MTRRRITVLVLVLLAVFLGPLALALAQSGGEPASGLERVLAWFLGQAAVVTMIVNALKTQPFVRSHPKATAALLNTLAVFAADLLYGIIPGRGLDDVLVKLIAGVAAGFGSTGFYEQVVKPGVTIVIPPK